ncbi:hypothetical protein QQ056_14840 [Oscillatoria laete-virens NRMC-F 0139]|nr:hypothetical protein [Oscillatoria laete-virens]MDL5054814.1 hypothetical protein [Oscillatoria laete-virens NRMC-F 0139]
MNALALASLAALIMSITCLRLAWGGHLRLRLGLVASVALLVAGVLALVPHLGEGRAIMAMLAAVLPTGAGFLWLGREIKPGRGQAVIARRADKGPVHLHLLRWLMAGPAAGLLAFGLALCVGFLPGMAAETRVALVACLWPLLWAILGIWALSLGPPAHISPKTQAR